jgi:NAD(P)-dependent dehydrogenase (short-subunit alcohol dehydrogenase family)
MNRQNASATTTVVIVLDGDTDAGHRLARDLLAQGRCVAVVARHPGAAVGVMHGHPADRVMAIGGDVADPRQWRQLTKRVVDRFGRIDAVVRGASGSDAALRTSA